VDSFKLHGEATSFPNHLSGFRCITTNDEIAVEWERIRVCLALGGDCVSMREDIVSRGRLVGGVFCVNRSPKRVVQISGDGVGTKEMDN